MNKFLYKINNLALVAFVFGVNFEYWDPFGLQGVFSIAKLTAIFYIISWIPFLNKVRVKSLFYFLVPLFLYLCIEFISSAINSRYLINITEIINFKLVQLLLLITLLVNHITSQSNAMKLILRCFIASVFSLSLLYLLGIGIEVDESISKGRLLLFGENSNMIGMKAAFAAVILLYYILNYKGRWRQLLSVGILFPIIMMLIATASRGALLSIFLGVGLIVVFQRISTFRKIILFAVGLFFSTWLFNYIMTSNEKFQMRMNIFLEEGNTGRNRIWDATYEIISDNIIFGVGRPGALPVMEHYLGEAKDPHNVFLYVLMTTGIVGFYFFMLFIFRLGKALYLQNKFDQNILFIVLYSILLFNMAKAGGFINKTFLWFFFALLIGVAQQNRLYKKVFNRKYENISYIK